MALDGVMLSCIITELKAKLLGGKVEKVYQPERDEINIVIRCGGKNYKLLMSASANNARIHITGTSKINPQVAPAFCMVLRKHILSGKIVDIVQPNFERIVEIHIQSINELGDMSIKKLIIEIMGKHSNIILVNEENKIIDCIRHVTSDMSRIREVLPGNEYVYPPARGKISPINMNRDTLINILFQDKNQDKKLDNVIFQSFAGVSKITAKEIVYRAVGNSNMLIIKELNDNDKENAVNSFLNFFKEVSEEHFAPFILQDSNNAQKDILPFFYEQYDLKMQIAVNSPSEAIEQLYANKDKIDRLKQHSSNLYKIIRTHLDRCYKKLDIQYNELKEAKKSSLYKLWGELLTANIYQIHQGIDSIELINYYDEAGKKEKIPLDRGKTPAQNAALYYKKYNKLKTASKMVSKQLAENKKEIEYLENQLHNLEKCTEYDELEEIKEELISQGYIKKKVKNIRKRQNTKISKPYHFISSDGFDIFVGKNNIQNDYLTLKIASGRDIWLHVKTIPGSHVIIKTNGEEVPDKTLLEAAHLAAFFSKGRLSSNVAVDYCPKKNVKKPNAAKPGMVIYDIYNTIYVTPDEDLIKHLSKE
ncbi:Rqc2 family fibronectin-binding protein [Xylanivirga thermophila]|uniref:Rqc2 family fibronectin-binding protein n=1 Tax=Xylanivirga thermophila TaxID=2496273 RepID=UPI00101B7020|nr:NFACT RNA binding domain-containing protein [Xylanivirga thermophila]